MLVAPVTSLGVGFEPSLLPVAATEWVREARPLGRMWNFWPFGGYLAWELGTEHEVFMDGRNTLARDRELVMRANRSIVDRAAFEALVEDYGIEWAISSASPADPRSGAGVAHDRRFAMTYLDDVAAVYVRSDGPNAELAGRGYRILRHDMPPETVVAIATGGGDAANALAHDGALAAAQAPASRRGAFLDACGALAAHDDDRFAAALARLERLGGDRALAAALRQIHGYD